ncbi:MAG: hypothetical protein WAM82_28595 [Thermoanaerobaculia bacterium]
MTTEPDPPRRWSEEEVKLLRHESFIAEVLRARHLGEGKKPRWQIFLESSSVTVLITVILGGWVGHLLTTSFQDRTRERELALANEKEVTAARLNTAKRALEDIGELVSGSESLIALIGDEWDPTKYKDPAKIEDQKHKIQDFYNSSDAKWRKEREILGALLIYYSEDQREIITSWDQAREAVDRLSDCARCTQPGQPKCQQPVAYKCERERVTVTRTLRTLVATLHASTKIAHSPR